MCHHMFEYRQRYEVQRLKVIAFLCIISMLIASLNIVEPLITLHSGSRLKDSKIDNSVRIENSRLLQINTIAVDGLLEWRYFTDLTTGVPGSAHITLTDLSGITVAAEISGFWWRNESLLTKDYGMIEIPGLTSMNMVGKPQLPRLIRYIEVPKGIDISIGGIGGSDATFSDYRIVPAQPLETPEQGQGTLLTSPLMVDTEVYSSNEFYPSSSVQIVGGNDESAIILRGRRLLEVSFFPIQYSPGLNQIHINQYMNVTLKFSIPAQIEPAKSSIRSQPCEEMFRSFLLNYKSWDTPENEENPVFPSSFITSQMQATSIAAEYLVIAADEYFSYAKQLAEWKNRTGLLSRIYSTTDIKTQLGADTNLAITSEQIRAFIKNVYDTWNPAPMYVLLFGDADTIPTNYEMVHQAKYSAPGDPDEFWYPQTAGRIGSDLPYFTVDGTDYIPDIWYGRISVDTVDQARDVVSKVLTYEMAPIIDSDFYDSILAAALYQDENVLNGDRQEDMNYQFLTYAESYRQYLKRKCYYTVYANYSANITEPHSLPFRDVAGVQLHLEDINQQTLGWIPSTPDGYQDAVNNITDNINDGRFFVYYIDHGVSMNMHNPWDDPGVFGSYEGWHAPRFNCSDVSGLTNGRKLPLVLSISCYTGWFDSETDQAATATGVEFTNDADCLSEILLRHEGGGAVAAIGATRITYNQPSDALLNGTIQAIWPGLLDGTNVPVYEFGRILHYGKMNVLKLFGYNGVYDEATEATFQMFHLFGDPTTPLWTESPSNMIVKYPTRIGTEGTQRFVVEVTDEYGFGIDDAKVCLQKGNEIFQVKYTNPRGIVEFDITGAHLGQMNITVTKHNFIPHVQEIEVIQSSATVSVSPIIGEKGALIAVTASGFSITSDPNSKVNIYIDNQWVADIQEGDPLTIESVVVPDGPYAPINVIANQSSHVTATTVFYRYPDTRPDPYVVGGNWQVHSIKLYEITTDSTGASWVATDNSQPHQLMLNQAYQVEVEVFNEGTTHASQVHVELWNHPFGAGLSWNLIGETGPYNGKYVESGGVAYATFKWTPKESGHTCFKTVIDQTYDVNTQNNVAQLNADVLAVHSPGNASLYVGNPGTTRGYLHVEVRQNGTYADYWNATIRGYESQSFDANQSESVLFYVEVPASVPVGTWRVFLVNLYINNTWVDGAEINVTVVSNETTTTDFPDPTLILVGVGFFATIAVLLYLIHRRKK